MGYGLRDGDVIALSNRKAGALTLSQNLYDFRPYGGLDPYDLWATQPAVRTVIGFIAQSVSTVPFNVYQGDHDGGKTIDASHPVHKSLHRPWPKQGQGRFIEALILDMYIYGRWGFLAMPDGAGGFEFPKLKANRFSLLVDGFGRYEGVAIHPASGGEPHVIPIDDVVFDLGPEPSFGSHRVGSTPVTTLEDLAKELQALGQYREDLFKNSARVPAVIERPKDAKWSEEAWQRFRTEFATYKAGGGNAGGTPILEDGMTYKAIDTVSPKDAQYIDVRKLALEEAAEALHVPPELVGAREGTYSNILALREQLYQDVLGPLIKWTEESLNAGLGHLLSEGEEIRADVDSKLRTDWATRSKIYQTSVGAPIMTVNEARAREGMPGIEGGDELITPMNVTVGGLASPSDTGQTNEPDPADPLPDVQLGKARPASGLKAKEDAAAGDTEDDNTYAPVDSEELQGAVAAFEKEILAEYKKITGRVWDRLGLDDIEESDGKAAGTKASGTLVGSDALTAAYQAKDAALIQAIVEKHLGDISAASSLQTLGELGAELGVWSAEAQYSWLSKAGETYTQLLIDENLYGKLRDIEENGVRQVQLRMQAILNKAHIDATKWVTGTATEVISFGANDAAKAAEATHKTWVTTSGRSRESHQMLNGMTIPVHDKFPNYLRWPGDWTGKGTETANCRCRLKYSIQEGA